MKIAVSQIKLSSQIEENLKKIIRLSKKASEQGVEILCFPECALTGYLRDFTKLDYGRTERALTYLQSFAKKEKINLIVGSPVIKNKKVFNSAVVLLKNGKQLLYYKRHLTEFDKKYFSAGKRSLSFKVKSVKCGVAVCRDQNYPEIFENYKKAGAKIVFILAAHYYLPKEAELKKEKNKALPVKRALDNKMFVAKAGAVGKIEDKVSFGHSLIASPRGFMIKEAGRAEETVLISKI